jgi:hypothetical protein
MPLFMDSHNHVKGATAQTVAQAHQADLKIQAQYGVKHLRYWVDESLGKIFCLIIALWIIGIGTNSVYAAGNQVPFVGFYSGTISIASDGTPIFNGTGIATHLGKGTNEGHVVFTGGSISCVGGIPNDNYETLTAANGDSLTLVSHDVACPIPNRDGWYHGTGHWEVTGGTGRFSGATGHGIVDGNAHIAPGGEFEITFTGTISAPSGH